MAYSIITVYGTAGNGANAAIETCPSGYNEWIGGMFAFASTAGASVTLSRFDNSGLINAFARATVAAGTTVAFHDSSVTPNFITLNQGNILYASASGSGVSIGGSGLRFG